MVTELTRLEMAALLAWAAKHDTLPGLAAKVNVREDRLLDIIEGKEEPPLRVVRYLGLQREVWYVRTR